MAYPRNSFDSKTMQIYPRRIQYLQTEEISLIIWEAEEWDSVSGRKYPI